MAIVAQKARADRFKFWTGILPLGEACRTIQQEEHPMTEPARKDVWSAGEAYEPYVGRWSRLVAAEFVDWLAVPKDARWLDVGCGTGALSAAILARGTPRHVVGIDLAEGFLAFARSHLSDSRIELRTGDAQSLPVVDASFDAA